ncbi:MAG: division/cell wall cluster transcriptional repressor MraZ [bacterium]
MEYFLGTYDYTIDDHNRLNIPAKFRKVMSRLEESNFIISKEQDDHLTVYPYKFWKTQIGDKIVALPHSDPKANRLRRLLGIKTTEVALDKQGRVNIPADYCNHAGIEKNVRIIGSVDTIQLWNPDTYDQISRVAEEQSLIEEYQAFGI